MHKHHGEIIEYTLRKNSFSISELARELGVNRRTMYNFFKAPVLKQHTILQIGRVLRHDFSQEFPELFTSSQFEPHPEGSHRIKTLPMKAFEEDLMYKTKYIELLEKYQGLLSGLIETV